MSSQQSQQEVGEPATSSYQQMADITATTTTTAVSSGIVSANQLEKQTLVQLNQKIEVSSPVQTYNTCEVGVHSSAQQNPQQPQAGVTLSLICEDRNSQRKCCFPSLIAEQTNINRKINIFNLFNSSLSVKAFLKGHLIFVEQDGMEIALGLFPFEMDKTFEMDLTQQGEKFSLKINHQKVSNHSRSRQSNRNKSSTNTSDATNRANQSQSVNSQIKQSKRRLTDSSSQVETNQNNSNLYPDDTKQEYNSLRKISSAGSSSRHFSSSSHSSEIHTHSSYMDNNHYIEEEDDDEELVDIIHLGKMKRNRNSTTSSSDQYMIERFHLSNTQNEIDEEKVIETDDNFEEEEEELCDDNEMEGSGSAQSKNSSIIKKPIKKERVQLYKPITAKLQRSLAQKIKGEHISSSVEINQQGQQQPNAVNSDNAPKKRRRQTLNKRSHERTIREGILLVTQWRNSHEYFKSKNQVKDLQEVAKDMGISKKTLDYYYLELRTAEFFNFDFDSHLNQRMGFLRQFIEDETKKFQEHNKQAKIPRQLNFKYRLPEHRSGNGNGNNSNSNNNNNNAGLNSLGSANPNGNLNMQLIQNQSGNHIYLPKDNFSSPPHQLMMPHQGSGHHQSQQGNYQGQHSSNYNSHIQSHGQGLPQIIQQQQKLNQILHQQQIHLGSGNCQSSHIQQIDANSTSSLSVFNQTTHESSLNQSDHNFLTSQATLHHYPAHQMQQTQPNQIFHNQNGLNVCDSKVNPDQLRIEQSSSNQIVDYSLQSGSNNRNLINQERNCYANYNLQNHHLQPDEFKPIFQYPEQQQPSGLDQINNSLAGNQSSQIGRFMSNQQPMITLPSTQSISESTHHLSYHQNHQRIQSQQNLKTNPDLLHPYEQKQQNEGYKQFLDKQKQIKQQESLLDESSLQHIMFE